MPRELRRSLKAPPGYKVLVGDLSQIEARLVAWVCGCNQLTSIFANGGDPYNDLATDIFGFPVDRKIHKSHGFIGKTGILGLGYGAGPPRFDTMVVTSSRLFGINLDDVSWSFAIAERAVRTYRTKYHQIPNGWQTLNGYLATWVNGGSVRFGPVVISQGAVTGPTGLKMKYGNPHYNAETREYGYTYGGDHYKIYGAKMMENIIQFLARNIIMDAAVRMSEHGYDYALQSHDELAYVVEDRRAEEVKPLLHAELARRPTWGTDIPLAAEVQLADNYGDAK